MPSSHALQPVIIIGAARSGTKFLRDVLAVCPGTRVVPYDVNYLWRSGNESWPDDCLPAELCNPVLAARIRRSLVKVSEVRAAGEPGVLLEKTVSNCLRVPFVAAVLPDAAFKYARNMLAGRLSAGRGQRTWGPRYAGIDLDAGRLDLLTICAKQWDTCVTASLSGLQGVDPSRVISVRYEDFATHSDVAADLARWLGLGGVDAVVAEHRAVSRSDAIRSGRRLPADLQARLDGLLGPTLARLGYS